MPAYLDLVPVRSRFTQYLTGAMDVVRGVRLTERVHDWFDFQSRVAGIAYESDL